MKKLICCYMVLLLPLLGQAKIAKILDITAQSDANIMSAMSLDLDDKNIAKTLIYHPDVHAKETKTHTIPQLLKEEVTLKSQKSIKVIGLKLKQVSPTSYVVTLNYLFQYKLFNKTYKEKQLNVSYSAPDNRYLVQDNDTKKMISKLHFLSNYGDNGKEIGIQKIETL